MDVPSNRILPFLSAVPPGRRRPPGKDRLFQILRSILRLDSQLEAWLRRNAKATAQLADGQLVVIRVAIVKSRSNLEALAATIAEHGDCKP